MSGKTSIPYLSLADKRLHPTDHLVMGALCFFADPDTSIASPHRQHIATMLGIHETKVSVATKRLEKCGWILKDGAGRSTQYYINWSNEPEQTLAVLAMVNAVDNYKTVAESATDKTSQTGLTLPNSATDETGVTGQTLPDKATVQTGRIGQTGLTLPNSATDKTDVTSQTLPDSGRDKPKNEICEHTISRSDSDSDSDSDILNKSESVSEVLTVTFHSANRLLKNAHCPYTFKEHSDNNGSMVIKSWVDRGITEPQLIEAIQIAIASPTRTGALGPRYVDGCLNTVLTKQKNEQYEPIPGVNDHSALEKYAAKLGISTKGFQNYFDLRTAIASTVKKLKGAA